MKTAEADRTKKDSTSKQSTKRLAQFLAKTNKPGLTRTFRLGTYRDKTSVLPVYAHYTTLRRNMLVEDDNHRTFYTSFGDDPDDDESSIGPKSAVGNGDIRDQEDIIAQNQKVWHQLNSMTERAQPYAPLVEDMLEELGCSVESILRYLVDDLRKPPAELPKELLSVWKGRDQFLEKEGFYDDADESGVKRTQKRWTAGLERLIAGSEDSGRRRAAAGLAFMFFAKITGFSLWHVVRVSHLTQDVGIQDTRVLPGGQTSTPKSSTERSPLADLRTYTDLACLACKA